MITVSPLVAARYANAKLEHLEPLNARLDLLRLQIRLLHTFQLIDDRRYEHVARLVEEVGRQLGGWISQQRRQGQTLAHVLQAVISACTSPSSITACCSPSWSS